MNKKFITLSGLIIIGIVLILLELDFWGASIIGGSFLVMALSVFNNT